MKNLHFYKVLCRKNEYRDAHVVIYMRLAQKDSFLFKIDMCRRMKRMGEVWFFSPLLITFPLMIARMVFPF
jgi:hypothetical protein